MWELIPEAKLWETVGTAAGPWVKLCEIVGTVCVEDGKEWMGAGEDG